MKQKFCVSIIPENHTRFNVRTPFLPHINSLSIVYLRSKCVMNNCPTYIGALAICRRNGSEKGPNACFFKISNFLVDILEV